MQGTEKQVAWAQKLLPGVRTEVQLMLDALRSRLIPEAVIQEIGIVGWGEQALQEILEALPSDASLVIDMREGWHPAIGRRTIAGRKVGMVEITGLGRLYRIAYEIKDRAKAEELKKTPRCPRTGRPLPQAAA